MLEAGLSRIQDKLALMPEDFEHYVYKEKKYLESLKEPSPVVSCKIKYVQALNDLAWYQLFQIAWSHFPLLIHSNLVSRKEWEEACEAVNTFATHVHSISSKMNMLTMNQTQICLGSAWTKYEKTLEYVGTLEVDLDIQKRWTALKTRIPRVLPAEHSYQVLKCSWWTGAPCRNASF